jgi:hypothetical protein
MSEEIVSTNLKPMYTLSKSEFKTKKYLFKTKIPCHYRYAYTLSRCGVAPLGKET